MEAVTIQARVEPSKGSRVSSKSNKIFHSVGAEGGFGRVGPATNNGRVEPTDGYFEVSRYFFLPEDTATADAEDDALARSTHALVNGEDLVSDLDIVDNGHVSALVLERWGPRDV